MRLPKNRAVLVLCTAIWLEGGHARAADRHGWEQTTRLRAGERIAIYRAQQEYPEVCDFVSADADALTCAPVDAQETAPEPRLVFPRAAIREIDSFQAAPDRHIGTWIAAGITVGLVTALCVANPLVGMLAGTTALGVWADIASGPPLLPPSSGPRIRRRLICRAPASPPATP